MTYPGGKNASYQQIVNLIPPHRTYIETHLGSGAIMRNKRPALLNIGIEINPVVFKDTVGAIAKNGEHRVPLKMARGQIVWAALAPSILARWDPIAVYGGALESPHVFVQADCVQLLEEYPFKGDEFVYLDPPYLMSTRRSQRPLYEYEYTRDDHKRLLACIQQLPCYVMISGYWSKLYAQELADWHTYTYTATTRGGGQAEEWLWMNYPAPVALHDYSYVGEDYRERERIKRKVERWVDGLQRLEPLERNAILSAIQETFLPGYIAISDGAGQHRHKQRYELTDPASSKVTVAASTAESDGAAA